MRKLRTLTALGVAGMLAGALALTAGSAVFTATPASRQQVQSRLSASYLAEARAALVSYLRHQHPRIAPAHGVSHGKIGNATAVSSYNWSGYEEVSPDNGTFTSVSGNWRIPAVRCTKEDQLASTWVGLDGFSDATVEQVGTLQWCYLSKPTYYTWYEMYPANAVTVGMTAQPDDQISASVSAAAGAYTLTLTDSTTAGNNINQPENCAVTTCLDTSAEWVAERPSFSIGVAPLADYGTWDLTGGKVTHNAADITIYRDSMIDATGAYDLSTVSALKAGAFTATWKNSY